MKQGLWLLSFALVTFFGMIQPSFAAAGNDNPTGVTGDYNGNVTTAGSYDPYTGNAKRFITDLTVTGSIGVYPLKWTRVLNTRNGQASAPFGQGGTWRHSYQWGMLLRPPREYHYYPDQYEGPEGMLYYPDGRAMELEQDPDGNYVQKHPSQNFDRLENMGDGNHDLVMADGGRVKFLRTGPWTGTTYSLRATEIIDPYGQKTILAYDGNGRLSRITEPGRRFLQINYITFSYDVSWPKEDTRYVDVIGSVQAFSRFGQHTETVSYTYDPEQVGQMKYYNLIRVDYADATHAAYTYCPAPATATG